VRECAGVCEESAGLCEGADFRLGDVRVGVRVTEGGVRESVRAPRERV
jgi:hypothetical protein